MLENVEDVRLELRPELAESAYGQLAKMIASGLSPDEIMATSFWPIIIELLPELADILSRLCDPEGERLAKALQTNRPLVKKRFTNQINKWTVRSQGRDVYADLGGSKFGGVVLGVLGDPDNESLVVEAYSSPNPVAPIWGIFDVDA